MKASGFSLLLLLAFVHGCACEKSPSFGDAGTDVDAGADAGSIDSGVDAGAPDAGLDPDAGPPPELKLLKVLPPRGSSAGGTQVLLTGSGFVRNFASRGSVARQETKLRFGNNPVVDIQIIDDETMEIRSPPGKAGLTNLTLENPNGTFVCSGCFTYFDDVFLSGVSPKEGTLHGGNELTLQGGGFTPDMHVLLGDVSSPQVTFVSSTELKVVAPPRALAEAVDVVLYSKNGQGSLPRAYTYVAPTRVATVAPLTGPLSGGTSVVLTGQGLSGATSVRFGSTPATSFTVESSTRLVAVAPAGTSLGAVDLTVVTPRESWTVKKGFAYVDGSGGFAAYGVFPHVVSAAGGDTVTVTGQGWMSGSVSVTVGGVLAPVVSATSTEVRLTVPAQVGSARRASIQIEDGVGSAILPDALTFRLQVSSVAPDTGSSLGGTSVTVGGLRFPPDAQAWLGAQQGTLQGAASATSLTMISPTGSSGARVAVRVNEASDPENEAALSDAYTFEAPLAIGRVQPGRGAIAGGALVTVRGAGFGDGTVVDFGAQRAKDIKIIDSHTLQCRAPRNDVGTVDVKVMRAGQSDTLPAGFSYFDPRSLSGGLSGGPLSGTLNISVLESTRAFYGMPVPLATVMLGSDPTTPFQGLTDARGQLTFSENSLVKAQTVTVFKEGFESVTVTSVNAENLTVLIARTGGEGDPSPPPPGPPPSLISGRVTGFKAPRPLSADETLEARVFLAQSSFYEGPPFAPPSNRSGEKWRLSADGQDYLLLTNAGLHAAYAILGVRNAQTGAFSPYLMGIKRGITTSPDSPASGHDIVLDMHLDMTVPITIDSPISLGTPPTQLPATNAVYAWLDLGAEGFIPNPTNWDSGGAAQTAARGEQVQFSMPYFPRLDGSNFVFLNEAAGASIYPVSYFYRRQPGTLSTGLSIGPMLPTPRIVEPTPLSGFTGTLRWETDPGPTPDIIQVLVLKPTLGGTVTLWSVVLPGTETQVVLPAPAVTKLKAEEVGNALYVAVLTSRSPKFNYAQWTYDTLSGVSWSSYTIALTDGIAITP